jgi:hypothetical protein
VGLEGGSPNEVGLEGGPANAEGVLLKVGEFGRKTRDESKE